jgi:hypothetical protein
MNFDKIQTAEMERANRKISNNQSFIARNYWLWVVVAFILYPLSAIFSALTEGGHILLRSRAMLGEGIAPIIITIILVLMIECLKYFLGKGAVDDLQANPFSEGGSALAAFGVKFIGFIGIMTFSVMLSVNGAGMMNEHFRKTVKPVNTEAGYLDESAILSRYEQELLPHRENIKQYSKIKWKGTITVDARRIIRAEQRQIDQIIAARDTELARARENNDGMKSEWAADTQENSSYAMGFAGLGEAVCLFCLIFIGIYDDGIKKQVRGVTLRTYDVTPIQRPTISPQRNAPALVAEKKEQPPQIMRELRERQAQQAQPENPQNQVATKVYAQPGALETAAQIKVDQRTLRAYRHKLRNGIGNPVTNQTHIDRLEAKIEDLKAQLG